MAISWWTLLLVCTALAVTSASPTMEKRIDDNSLSTILLELGEKADMSITELDQETFGMVLSRTLQGLYTRRPECTQLQVLNTLIGGLQAAAMTQGTLKDKAGKLAMMYDLSDEVSAIVETQAEIVDNVLAQHLQTAVTLIQAQGITPLVELFENIEAAVDELTEPITPRAFLTTVASTVTEQLEASTPRDCPAMPFTHTVADAFNMLHEAYDIEHIDDVLPADSIAAIEDAVPDQMIRDKLKGLVMEVLGARVRLVDWLTGDMGEEALSAHGREEIRGRVLELLSWAAGDRITRLFVTRDLQFLLRFANNEELKNQFLDAIMGGGRPAEDILGEVLYRILEALDMNNIVSTVLMQTVDHKMQPPTDNGHPSGNGQNGNGQGNGNATPETIWTMYRIMIQVMSSMTENSNFST